MDKLPKGWDIVGLSEVCTVLGGGTPKTSINDYWNGEIIWLSPTDLPEIGSISKISSSTKKITQLGLNKSSAKLLPKGSVVFSSRASIGKIGIAEIELTTNQGFTNFICSEKISNHYLCYVLKRSISEIASLSNSTTFAEVSKSSIKSFQIPLPPLPEQKRIVSKLDALFERIDKSIALLGENIKQTEHLMASALDEIFKNLASKSKVYKVSDFADIKGGKRLPKGLKVQETKTDYPYIRVADFQDNGTVDLSSLQYITKEAHEQIKRYIINPEDLYISIAGTIGKTGIIPNELKGANLTENAARFVFKSNFDINSKFIYYFTLSDSFNAQISEATKTVAQPKLALTRLKEVTLPIPNIERQNKAVEQFEILSLKTQLIVKEQNDKLSNLKVLKESILDKAFKGGL